MIVGAAELVNNMRLCCARCGGTEAEQVELNRLLCGPQRYGFVLGPKALHCHTKQGHTLNRFWLRSLILWGSATQSCSGTDSTPRQHKRRAHFYHWRELSQVSFLSWQNRSFVATKVCLLWQNFCSNKIMFIMTEDVFCHDKSKLMFVTMNIWHDKTFVATNMTKMIPVAAPTNDTLSMHSPNHWLCEERQCCFVLGKTTIHRHTKQRHHLLFHLHSAPIKCASYTLQVQSSNEMLLKIPKHNLKSFCQCSFSFITLPVWNLLPASLRHLPTLSKLKNTGQDFLFQTGLSTNLGRSFLPAVIVMCVIVVYSCLWVYMYVSDVC